jgi:hypothetical protein
MHLRNKIEVDDAERLLRTESGIGLQACRSSAEKLDPHVGGEV